MGSGFSNQLVNASCLFSATCWYLAMTGDSKKLIETLLKAEKQAEELIATAKKNRLTKLREAKTAADEELSEFKKKEEQTFQNTIGSKAQNDPQKELASSTEAELKMVQQDYENNKQKTVAYVVSKVLDVPINLTNTQKQALKA